MSANGYDGFFVGWGKKLPTGLPPFLIVSVLFMLGLFAGTAFSFVITQNNPGDGAFRFDIGRQTVIGVLEARPYPVIHVSPNDKYPDGHSIMLTGQGKRGVMQQAKSLDGQQVQARGVLLKRGALDMLQVAGRMKPAGGEIQPVDVTDLGTWRLSGEICDGKCYAGAMRPGTGLAHKACANLCIIGGTPAVFVSKGEVDGSSFFMLSDEQGNPLDDRLFGITAVLLSAEGQIEKRGDLHLFKINPDSVQVQ